MSSHLVLCSVSSTIWLQINIGYYEVFGSRHGYVLQISAPLAVIGGHSKAVSYVRWVGSNQVISASTDNHLKLWDVAEAASLEGNCAPITSFTGDIC